MSKCCKDVHLGPWQEISGLLKKIEETTVETVVTLQVGEMLCQLRLPKTNFFAKIVNGSFVSIIRTDIAGGHFSMRIIEPASKCQGILA